jgi:hypothetical protein
MKQPFNKDGCTSTIKINQFVLHCFRVAVTLPLVQSHKSFCLTVVTGFTLDLVVALREGYPECFLLSGVHSPFSRIIPFFNPLKFLETNANKLA